MAVKDFIVSGRTPYCIVLFAAHTISAHLLLLELARQGAASRCSLNFDRNGDHYVRKEHSFWYVAPASFTFIL